MMSVNTINKNILRVCTIRKKQVSGQTFYRFTVYNCFWLMGGLFTGALIMDALDIGALIMGAFFTGALIMGTLTMGGLIRLLFCGTLTGFWKYFSTFCYVLRQTCPEIHFSPHL